MFITWLPFFDRLHYSRFRKSRLQIYSLWSKNSMRSLIIRFQCLLIIKFQCFLIIKFQCSLIITTISIYWPWCVILCKMPSNTLSSFRDKRTHFEDHWAVQAVRTRQVGNDRQGKIMHFAVYYYKITCSSHALNFSTAVFRYFQACEHNYLFKLSIIDWKYALY